MVSDARIDQTLAIIREIDERLQRGAPVTQDLLDRIPHGMGRIELSGTIRVDDQTQHGTFLIENGAVKYYPVGERPN